MATLILDRVTIDFPIYDSQKTFRSALRAATGGLITRDARTPKRVTVRALDDVSLTLKDGDRLGLIGHNGAGKSTLLRVCAQVYEPTQGRIFAKGKISPLFNAAPGLDTDDTGYENIMTCALLMGMTRDEIVRKTPDIAEFSGLGEYLFLPVRTYSSGMLTRLSFSIATAIDPEILILDEGLGTGDAQFAEQAKQRVDALIARSSILILASHSDALIQSMCNKAILLQSGAIVREGSVKDVLAAYHNIPRAS
jgi:ABC-type polysaccharide/polyol phosphate transport system ATPase subunit